jgi:hypothetical protein
LEYAGGAVISIEAICADTSEQMLSGTLESQFRGKDTQGTKKSVGALGVPLDIGSSIRGIESIQWKIGGNDRRVELLASPQNFPRIR